MKYEQVSVDPHGFKFKGCHISNGTVSGWNFNLYQGSRRFKSLEDPSAIQWTREHSDWVFLGEGMERLNSLHNKKRERG